MRPIWSRRVGWIAWIVTIASVGVLALSGGVASASHVSPSARTLSGSTLVSTPPAGATGPDDLTQMAILGLDHGAALVWTEFQNGVNPDGSAGSPGGPTQSTVAGFDPISGRLVYSINVTGHVDGLTADPAMGVILATANEDDNSDLNVISPATNGLVTYNYTPNPAVLGVGGTDSLAIDHGVIYISHSNPNDTTQATTYSVRLNATSRVATLTPLFYDDSLAASALGGGEFNMALTDPDTNYVMPHAGERFAGTLATISQGDGKLIFASHLAGTVRLSVLNLTDNVSGNLPPIDGLAVATADGGTLYVVDSGANTISALSTSGFPRGTIFVTEPKDNRNPLLGVLNPWTGHITSLGNHFVSPKGLLFVPDHDPHHHLDHDGHGGWGRSWGGWFLGRW